MRTSLSYLLMLTGLAAVIYGFSKTNHGMWAYDPRWETPGIIVTICGMVLLPRRKR